MVLIINTALFEEQLSSHRLEQTTTNRLWLACFVLFRFFCILADVSSAHAQLGGTTVLSN